MFAGSCIIIAATAGLAGAIPIASANIQTILDQIESGNSINASWSATFQPETNVRGTTPEPATFLILGAGFDAGRFVQEKSR